MEKSLRNHHVAIPQEDMNKRVKYDNVLLDVDSPHLFEERDRTRDIAVTPKCVDDSGVCNRIGLNSSLLHFLVQCQSFGQVTTLGVAVNHSGKRNHVRINIVPFHFLFELAHFLHSAILSQDVDNVIVDVNIWIHVCVLQTLMRRQESGNILPLPVGLENAQEDPTVRPEFFVDHPIQNIDDIIRLSTPRQRFSDLRDLVHARLPTAPLPSRYLLLRILRPPNKGRSALLLLHPHHRKVPPHFSSTNPIPSRTGSNPNPTKVAHKRHFSSSNQTTLLYSTPPMLYKLLVHSPDLFPSIYKSSPILAFQTNLQV
mmetsp:Transcript_4014/g.16905  ORF Transcript_4014/g.16905 Transcript_4014/m.16905 type:complete len:313 (+) Transcript_4014:1201-2139(+)